MATIKEMQQRLTALGYSPGKADGIMGGQTKLAIRQFQTAVGLTADGIVGPKTEAALFNLPKVVKPVVNQSTDMKTSAAGRKVLIQREGSKLVAYLDTVGVWTIGVGHTAAAGPPAPVKGMKITAAECDEILTRDLVQYEDAVNKAITQPMTQNEFDAMLSLCFNIGTGGFSKSTLVKKFNAGDKQGAADEFLVWSKQKELLPRRKAERTQFLTP